LCGLLGGKPGSATNVGGNPSASWKDLLPGGLGELLEQPHRSRRMVVWCVRCSGVVLAIGLTVANNNERGEDP
jgi:hypothetical protein